MADRDSVFPFDDNNPFPFMQDPPNAPHQNLNFLHSRPPNSHHAQYPSPDSSRIPRNHSSGSGSGAESSYRTQEIESAMGGLRLSGNPYRLNATGMGPYSSDPLYASSPQQTNFFADQIDYLLEKRIRDAVYATMGAQGFNNYNLSGNYGLGYGRVMNNHVRPSSWRVQLVSMAKDSHGCRVLQGKINEGKEDEIWVMISGLKHNLHELMAHNCGNHVVERLFDSWNVTLEQVNCVLNLLLLDLPKLQSVCMDVTGTRVVQRILLKLSTHTQIYIFTLVMKLMISTLMKNVNGCYVIQKCVKHFPLEYEKLLLDEIACNCVDIAIDRCGSSAIQKCLGLAEEGAIFPLVREIILNASILAQDPYGNYLVQYLIQMQLNEPPANKLMVQHLSGEFVRLSMDKHASNVIEALLQCSEPDDVVVIVEEIMKSPEFMNVLRDPFGNFVVQRAIECTEGNLRKTLCYFIRSNCRFLSNHPYGKNVLAFAKRCRVDA